MKILTGLFSAAVLVAVLTLAPPSVMACNGNGNCENAPGHLKGAPGPIAGAGLPFLAAGYGIYWLIRRRRDSRDR